MAVAVQTLSKLSFFSRLGNDVLAEIALHTTEHTFAPGQVVILEGEPCQAVYFRPGGGADP